MIISWICLLAAASVVYAEETSTIDYDSLPYPPIPRIHALSSFVVGETFTLNCTTQPTDPSVTYTIRWNKPSNENIEEKTNIDVGFDGSVIYRTLTINNATAKNEGFYRCVTETKYKRKHKGVSLHSRAPGYLKLIYDLNRYPLLKSNDDKTFVFPVLIDATNPLPEWSFKHNGDIILSDGKKYLIEETYYSWFKLARLTVNNVNVNDSGNYTFTAVNPFTNKSILTTFDFKEH